jgi:hypothetical protein
MAGQIIGPHKRRSRQHVIADLSVHHVEGFILEESHTPFRLTPDYGYDLVLFIYDENGFLEPGSVYFQLKAAEGLKRVGSDFVFDIDIRDYNLWTNEKIPVILILFDAGRKRAFWLHVQGYFRDEARRPPSQGAKSVRVRVSSRQGVNRKAVQRWRDLKWESWARASEGQS